MIDLSIRKRTAKKPPAQNTSTPGLLCGYLVLIGAIFVVLVANAKPMLSQEDDQLVAAAAALAVHNESARVFALTTLKPTPAPTTLREIIGKLASVFAASSSDASTTTASFSTVHLTTATSSTTASTSTASTQTPESNDLATATGRAQDNRPSATSDRTTTERVRADDGEREADDKAADAADAEEASPEVGDACEGLASTDTDARGRPLSGAQRLVNLQSCMQSRVRRRLAGATRSSLELFEKLSLSGGCTSSLMGLMGSLGELRAFAFKFLDASAKVPSGMMYGLLSDFGDFDQCLSIRSDPRVDPRDEEDERAYSGKYCLLNVRLKYHVDLANASAPPPEGIYPDGVLWDPLVRNYWTSNSTKGFQVGVCVPSRCTSDDLEQIYKLMAETYYFDGQVTTCQDSNDLRRQQTPDWLQLIIVHLFLFVVALNTVGSLVERYCAQHLARSRCLELITCFAIQRNWRVFLRGHSVRLATGQAACAHSGSATVDSARATSPPVAQTDSQAASDSSVCGPSTSDGSDSSFMDCPSSGSSAASSTTSGCQDHLEDEEREEHTEGGERQLERGARAPQLAIYRQLTVKIVPDGKQTEEPAAELSLGATDETFAGFHEQPSKAKAQTAQDNGQPGHLLSHLSGLKLLVIVWITGGHSFLYPSANNYQYYRSIINMNITRDSVWFATTNFTLGTDMLLYMTGLLFVYKLSLAGAIVASPRSTSASSPSFSDASLVLRHVFRRLLRFWPTYLSVIALAIVMPLAADGPMWPEMVTNRLGATCRSYWWANLLMVNNFLSEPQVCLPSSWFLSVLMQCLLVGSLLIVVARARSTQLAVMLLASLLALSSAISFALAYVHQVGAPAIRMDESFVMELDGNIFRMYTNTLNNLGPFLVGMLGGFLLVRWRHRCLAKATGAAPARNCQIERLSGWMFQLNLAFAVTLTATLVLSSVFFTRYTRFWAAVYWSCHRVGWALVTGYLIHQCATNRWRLLKDLLSLRSLMPLSRLIFIAYLVFPIFIHVHSGLVRDGLHVSIYNMLNIYTTRLVMTFATALALHLLIELPFCALEELLLGTWLRRIKGMGRPGATTGRAEHLPEVNLASSERRPSGEKTIHPLLAVVPIVAAPS